MIPSVSKHFSRDVARFGQREEDISGRNFGGLARPAHRCLLSKSDKSLVGLAAAWLQQLRVQRRKLFPCRQ